MNTLAATQPGMSRWILGPKRDLAFFVLPTLWILPLIAFLNHRFDIAVFGGALLAIGSVGHHLPGFIRAYTDPDLFRRHRVRFIAAPLFFAAVCAAFALLNLHSLTLLLVMWGAWHGAMQVHGFLRIYDAKAGISEALTARLDAWMCIVWFGGGLLHSSSRMPAFLTLFYGSGGALIPPGAFATLRLLGDILIAAVTVAFAVNAWVRVRRGTPPNLLKWLAMASAFGFWWLAMVGLDNLLLGLVLFEIFHDVQYNAIVWAYNRRRVSGGATLGRLERFVFAPGWNRLAMYALLVAGYGVLGVVADYSVTQTGFLGEETQGGVTLWTQIFVVSAFLHFYFDGFIWKIRDPELQRGLELSGEVSAPAPSRRITPALKWGFLFVLPATVLGYTEYRGQAVPMRRQYDNMAEILPHNWYVNFVLASLENADHDFDRSILHYERALAARPDLGPAHASLGDLYGRKGRHEEAIQHYTRAVDLQADDFHVRSNLGELLLSQRRYAEALPHLQAASDMNPGDAALSYRVGMTFMHVGNPAAAIPYLRRAAEGKLGTAQALNSLGIALQTLGDIPQAVNYYQRALQADPALAGAQRNLEQAQALLRVSRR